MRLHLPALTFGIAALRLRIGILFIITLVSGAARDKAPDWVLVATRHPVTLSTESCDAIILLHENRLEVSPSGAIVTRSRTVTRILRPEGRSRAVASLAYVTDGTKILSFQAWVVRPGGEVVVAPRKQMVDAVVHTTALELYGEARLQSLRMGDQVGPGDVFASESVVEERGIISQRAWNFAGPLPIQRSVMAVDLPPDWQVRTFPFNGAPDTAVREGRTQVWSMEGLNGIVTEPSAPPPSTFAPWIGLNLTPPPGARSIRRVVFSSWPEVSAYFSPLFDTAAAVDASIQARAREVAGAAPSAREQINALCRHVQKINYISIQLDAASAGGMIPRSAARVLRCNYGDCKDKTTLLRALLSSQGIPSYPLVVAVGSPQGLKVDWASPGQFNHCILAIPTDETPSDEAVLDHPELGRLLIFDPTDAFTAPGHLGSAPLGRQGLLLAGDKGGLVTLPERRPETSRVERTLKAQLTGEGGISGTLEERRLGLPSSIARRERRAETESAFRSRVMKSLGAGLMRPSVSRLETKDDFDRAEFRLELEFTSAFFGKLMRNELIVFRPAVLPQPGALKLRPGPRTLPLLIDASAFHERAEIALPDGWEVEELTTPTQLKFPFGTYSASSRQEGRLLVYERSLTLQAGELPAKDYGTALAFFDKVLQSDQNPVVLKQR
ncbi:MAG: DUF3857 domain-containing protein [Opitutaceae bacterium]|nr:DUF3857 domain-containing protein [Opitutaceae bacterium]